MQDLIDRGFSEVGKFWLTPKGKLKIEYPHSIKSLSGVLAISDEVKVKYITATRNYGPRIQAILYSNNGSPVNTDSRINNYIKSHLLAGESELILWKKDESDPHPTKNILNAALEPEWARQ